MKLTQQQLYDKYFNLLFVHVMKYVDHTEEARDIVLVTFNKLFDRFQDFINEPESDARGFLYTASKNDAFNYLRKRKLRAVKYRLFVQGFDPMEIDNDELDGLLIARLYDELQKLPPRSKQVIKLLYFDKLSYRAVSEKLHITEKSIQNVRKYALDLLRKGIPSRELLILGLIAIKFFN